MFECKLCDSTFEKITALTTHIQFRHKEYTTQTYYDKFFKKEGEGLCKTCGKPTRFRTLFAGYSLFCSNKCVWQDPEVKAKRAESISKLTEEQVSEWWKKNIASRRNSEGYCITKEEAEKRAEISKKSFEEYFGKCNCTFVSYVVHPKRLVTFRCNKCGNEATYVRNFIDRMARTNDYGICHYCNNRKLVSTGERELRKFLNDLAPEEIKLNYRHLIEKMELDSILEHEL